MASLLCVQQLGGDVKVHDSKMAETLIAPPADTIETPMPKSCMRKSKTGRPRTTPTLSGRQPTMDATSLIDSTMKMQDWLSERTVMGLQGKRRLSAQRREYCYKEERNDKESQGIREMYTPLLETEQTFVKEMDEYLAHKDYMNTRKRELLHKTWNDRVYEPMRREILHKLDHHDWPEVDRRRRVLHKQYLEHLNKKGHIFLDTMDKGEYYAQALNSHRPAPIMIYTPELRDPLLSQQRDRNKEQQTILRCQTGNNYSMNDINQIRLPPLPLVPLGRHGTDSVAWLEMPLGNIESTPRKASRFRKTTKKMKIFTFA